LKTENSVSDNRCGLTTFIISEKLKLSKYFKYFIYLLYIKKIL